jgi:SOS response regulatory protein OraA/RecX
LRAKGIDQPLIRGVIGAIFARGDEEKNAQTLLNKRFRGVDLSDPKTSRRACAFLERRGYSSQVIFDLVQRRAEDD